jgi:hypothetical protein
VTVGYYTRYEFDSIEGPDGSSVMFAARIHELHGFDPLRDGADEMKWYEHDEHIVDAMSRSGVTLVKLSGKGEEQGDVWDKIYTRHDGLVRVHEYKHKLVRPDFATRQFDIEVKS